MAKFYVVLIGTGKRDMRIVGTRTTMAQAKKLGYEQKSLSNMTKEGREYPQNSYYLYETVFDSCYNIKEIRFYDINLTGRIIGDSDVTDRYFSSPKTPTFEQVYKLIKEYKNSKISW